MAAKGRDARGLRSGPPVAAVGRRPPEGALELHGQVLGRGVAEVVRDGGDGIVRFLQAAAGLVEAAGRQVGVRRKSHDLTEERRETAFGKLGVRGKFGGGVIAQKMYMKRL